jgi:hypothetical protein
MASTTNTHRLQDNKHHRRARTTHMLVLLQSQLCMLLAYHSIDMMSLYHINLIHSALLLHCCCCCCCCTDCVHNTLDHYAVPAGLLQQNLRPTGEPSLQLFSCKSACSIYSKIHGPQISSTCSCSCKPTCSLSCEAACSSSCKLVCSFSCNSPHKPFGQQFLQVSQPELRCLAISCLANTRSWSVRLISHSSSGASITSALSGCITDTKQQIQRR